MDISSLPIECVAHIFRFLPVDSAATCERVCRKFRDASHVALLDANIIYYGGCAGHDLLLETLPFLSDNELKKYQITDGNRVLTQKFAWAEGRFINSKFFKFLLTRCPNLEGLITRYYVRPNDLLKLKANLRYLCCKFEQSAGDQLTKVMSEMVHLESLVLPTLQMSLCPFKLLAARLPLKYIVGPCGVICAHCDLGPCNPSIPSDLQGLSWRMEEWTMRSQSLIDVTFRESLKFLEMEIENEDVEFDFKFPALRKLKLNFYSDCTRAWDRLYTDLPVCTQLQLFQIQIRLIPPQSLELLVSALYSLNDLKECTIDGTIHKGEDEEEALNAFNNLIAFLSSRQHLTKLKLKIPVECDTIDYSVAISALASLPRLSYIEFQSARSEDSEVNCLTFLTNLNPSGPKSIYFEFSCNQFSLPNMSASIHDRVVSLLSSGRLISFSSNLRCCCPDDLCLAKASQRELFVSSLSQ